MPYKSRAQQGKFHAMLERGEIDPEVVEHWDKASKGQHGLPYHVKKKKKKYAPKEKHGFVANLEKSAKYSMREVTDWVAKRSVNGAKASGHLPVKQNISDATLDMGTELRDRLRQHLIKKELNANERISLMDQPIDRKGKHRKHLVEYIKIMRKTNPEDVKKVIESRKGIRA